MKNSFKLLEAMRSIAIITLAVIIGFSFAACPDGKTNNGNGNGDDDDIPFTSLSVQNKNIKSLYVSNVMVSDGGARAADSNLALSTLSYTTPLGQNAPVLFTSSSGKTYILEITDMKQIDDKRIAALHNGYYEVTITDGENVSYSISEKVDHYGSALIDMNSGRVYDFTEYHWVSTDTNDLNFGYNTGIRFIENNIAYVTQGWPEAILYKIDLTSASPQAIPLNSGAYTPMSLIRPSFTISNKILTGWWVNTQRYDYSVDISGTIAPKTVKWAQLPADIFKGDAFQEWDTYEKDQPVTMLVQWREQGVPMKDLAGTTWFFTQFDFWDDPQQNDGVDVYLGFGSWGSKVHYLLAKISLDDEGQYKAENVTIAKLNFEPAEDFPWTGSNANRDFFSDGNYLFFYKNAAGTGILQQDVAEKEDNRKAFLHDGIIMVNTKGFIRLIKRADKIEVESVSLNMPLLRAGRAVISKDNYLFWMDGTSIKRLDLKAGETETTIYSNSNIINSPLRDWITASGNKIIFYQYAEGSASTVYTYSIDMYTPNVQPVLLATNDMNVKAVAELNF